MNIFGHKKYFKLKKLYNQTGRFESNITPEKRHLVVVIDSPNVSQLW